MNASLKTKVSSFKQGKSLRASDRLRVLKLTNLMLETPKL